MNRFVATVSGWIYRSPRWALLSVLMIIAIVKSGVWVIPNIGVSAEIATNPFVAHPDTAYLVENWLFAFLGWLVHATTWQTLTALNAVWSIGFVVVVFVIVFRRLPDRAARTAALVFVALPVSTTAFYWLGLDSLTLLLMALTILVSRRVWFVAPIGVLLGMQHFEQAIESSLVLIGVAIIGRVLRVRPWRDLVFPLVLAGGVVIGKVLLTVILALTDSTSTYNRFQWFQDNALGLLGSWLSDPLAITYSMLGVGWLVVIRYAMRGRRALPVLIGLGVVALSAALYADHTRDLCIVSFLLIMREVLLDEELMSGIGAAGVSWFAMIWVIVPWIWFWGDVVQPNLITHDLRLILNRLFGWYDVPRGVDLPGWPWPWPPHI